MKKSCFPERYSLTNFPVSQVDTSVCLSFFAFQALILFYLLKEFLLVFEPILFYTSFFPFRISQNRANFVSL